jgi:hypothetical protein
MSKRTIEETFQAIKPKGRKGIPNPPTIGAGMAGDTGELTSSLSQAGQQISQLQAAYQQQAALISANTQAIQGNTSAQGSHSASSVAGGLASSLFGGALELLSPLISGIASLFGGSSSPAPLPFYAPPPAVAISASLNSATPALTGSGSPASNGGMAAGTTAAPSSPAGVQQVTVNVNAMDSQSFMDHSADIASAVREAMLNMHPINDVVSSL